MRLFLFILLSFIFTSSGYSQFEFEEIIPSNYSTGLVTTDNEVYSFDLASRRLSIINKTTKEVVEFNRDNGYKFNYIRGIQQLDSFIVVITGDDYNNSFDGFLTMNIYTKEFWLDTIYDHLYLWGISNWVKSCSDGEYVYAAFNLSNYNDRMLLKYKPGVPTDTLWLPGFPFSTNECITQLAINDSVFCGYTTNDRFIFWDIDNPSNYSSLPKNRPLIDELICRNNIFYFSGSETSGLKDSIYSIGSDLSSFQNLSQDYNILTSSNISKIDFINDSLVFMNSTGLYLHDTTDLITHYINWSYTYDFPSEPYDFCFDSDSVVYMGFRMKETNFPRRILYSIDRNNNIDSISVNKKNAVNNCQNSIYTIGFVNSRNQYMVLQANYFNIYIDENFIQIPLSDPYLSECLFHESSHWVNHYAKFEFEDTLGNVYGKIEVDYNPFSIYEDTIFYLMITPNLQEVYLSKDEYELVTEQKKCVVEEGTYSVESGDLSWTDGVNSRLIAHPESLPLRHVINSEGKIYCSNDENVYRFYPENESFESLVEIPYSPFVTTSRFSKDLLGNIYFTYGYLFYRIDFSSDEVEQLNILDSLMGEYRFLVHDAIGNVYSTTTINAVPPNEEVHFLPYYNGIEWLFPSEDGTNLAWNPFLYEFWANPGSSQIYFGSDQGLSVTKVTCPIREITEIDDSYAIFDSTDVININIEQDMDYVLWDNGSSDYNRKIDTIGSYWVKVVNDQGCSSFKSFEVELNPTVNNNSEEIFYYFETNAFPLIFEEGVEGDFRLYDMKGSIVREFVDYQNDWIPERDFQGSIMLFGIYNGDALIKSGRIIFI